MRTDLNQAQHDQAAENRGQLALRRAHAAGSNLECRSALDQWLLHCLWAHMTHTVRLAVCQHIRFDTRMTHRSACIIFT